MLRMLNSSTVKYLELSRWMQTLTLHLLLVGGHLNTNLFLHLGCNSSCLIPRRSHSLFREAKWKRSRDQEARASDAFSAAGVLARTQARMKLRSLHFLIWFEAGTHNQKALSINPMITLLNPYSIMLKASISLSTWLECPWERLARFQRMLELLSI